MSQIEEQPAESPAAPGHLWAVGVVSLLWNGFGAYDYIMSQTRNQDYMAAMTEPFGFSAAEAVAYFDSFPLWADAARAVGVWGSVLGSVLLLARRRHAGTAFIVSLGGLVVAMIYQFGNPLPGATDSTISLVFTILITLIMLGLIWYSKRMAARGVLR